MRVKIKRWSEVREIEANYEVHAYSINTNTVTKIKTRYLIWDNIIAPVKILTAAAKRVTLPANLVR